MAGFSYLNFEGDNQLTFPNNNTFPMSMFSDMIQEDSSSSSSGKRKRTSSMTGEEDNPLFRVCIRPRRVIKFHKPPPPSPTLPFRIINPKTIEFLFEKKLHRSDVGRVGSIILPKKQVEEHLPYNLCTKEGVWIHIDDMDYYKVWTLKFRYWQNNNSRIYIFDNTKEFVESHSLRLGDSIKVFMDMMTGTYVIQVVKADNVPGMIYKQCLIRSRENDTFFINGTTIDPIVEVPSSPYMYAPEQDPGTFYQSNLGFGSDLSQLENNVGVAMNQEPDNNTYDVVHLDWPVENSYTVPLYQELGQNNDMFPLNQEPVQNTYDVLVPLNQEPLENTNVVSMIQEHEMTISTPSTMTTFGSEAAVQLSEPAPHTMITFGNFQDNSDEQPPQNSAPIVSTNESFPPLDDFLGDLNIAFDDLDLYQLYGSSGVTEPTGQPFYNSTPQDPQTPSVESLLSSLWD